MNKSVGKRLAYTAIKFMNQKGDVFARGSHTKYLNASLFIMVS